MLQYIKNEQHYTFFIEAIRQARRTIWIGTADIKDLYIKEGKNAVPLLKLLEQKVKEGVEVRLVHAKEPGQNFRDDFDKYPLLWSRITCIVSACPFQAVDIRFEAGLYWVGKLNGSRFRYERKR